MNGDVKYTDFLAFDLKWELAENDRPVGLAVDELVQVGVIQVVINTNDLTTPALHFFHADQNVGRAIALGTGSVKCDCPECVVQYTVRTVRRRQWEKRDTPLTITRGK